MPINTSVGSSRSSFRKMATISVVLTRVAMLPFFILLFSISPTALSFTFKKLSLPAGVTGPASLAFDLLGGPYVSVQDGLILKYNELTAAFQDFAFVAPTRSKAVCDNTTNDNLGPTCGRPLGLDFNLTGNQLYIADAYHGLLVAGSNGRLATKVASGVNGKPFNFLFAVSLGLPKLTKDVYFTQFSAHYQLSDITKAILNGDATGSLLKYNPDTGKVTELLTRLSGAAGVAVSADGSHVLFSELIGKRINRYWIQGHKKGTWETIKSFEDKRPSRIKRAEPGLYWVALNEQKTPTSDIVPFGLLINSNGKTLLEVPLDKEYKNTRVGEILQYKEKYFIGSRYVDYVGVYGLI